MKKNNMLNDIKKNEWLNLQDYIDIMNIPKDNEGCYNRRYVDYRGCDYTYILVLDKEGNFYQLQAFNSDTYDDKIIIKDCISLSKLYGFTYYVGSCSCWEFQAEKEL